jgi:hypothetical protein
MLPDCHFDLLARFSLIQKDQVFESLASTRMVESQLRS